MVYSHDGIRDSLTQLAAPTLFFEELRRELARTTREHQRIAVIRFLLCPSGANPGAAAEVNRFHDSVNLFHDGISNYYNAIYDEHVVSFAHLLSQQTRAEDVCARMGELEFACMIHGQEAAVRNFLSRISGKWRATQSSPAQSKSAVDLTVQFAALVSLPEEKALELLNRLDFQLTSML